MSNITEGSPLHKRWPPSQTSKKDLNLDLKVVLIKGTSGLLCLKFIIYHLFQTLIIFTIESFHDILVIEWYYGKAVLIIAIKVLKINFQGYHVL